MSARKLGRLAGLVFVLAAILGGVSTQQGTASSTDAVQMSGQIIVDWG
jgi:hypothetical protein